MSGSGKSSILNQALGASVESMLAGGPPRHVERIGGLDTIGWLNVVGQDPIRRTPRSNPATYTKAFDATRVLFAKSAAAAGIRLASAVFSFNTPGGRCEACAGYGRRQIDMHFLPDVWVTCEACEGRRFGEEVLAVTYHGANVDDVLRMTVDEAAGFFADEA